MDNEIKMTKTQVMEAMRISARTVNLWVKKGTIKMLGDPGKGRGVKSVYLVPRDIVPYGYAKEEMPGIRRIMHQRRLK